MSEPWVVVARREDLADAEWEAAALREADVPAVVAEAPDGTLEIRVEAENVGRAEELLAKLEAPDADGPAATETAEPEAERATLTSISPERQQTFGRAMTLALIGWGVPLFLILAMVKIVRGYLRPEGMAFEDWYELVWAVFLTAIGLIIWGTLLSKVF